MLKIVDVKNGANIEGLASRIQKAMDARGMTQADLARATGMSTAQVSLIVSGKTKDPQFRSILLVADALDVSLNYLAGISRR